MEDLIEELTRGNVTEVKVVLASVVLGLAVYQVLLAAVAYASSSEDPPPGPTERAATPSSCSPA